MWVLFIHWENSYQAHRDHFWGVGRDVAGGTVSGPPNRADMLCTTQQRAPTTVSPGFLLVLPFLGEQAVPYTSTFGTRVMRRHVPLANSEAPREGLQLGAHS